jgi:hypothetical protein
MGYTIGTMLVTHMPTTKPNTQATVHLQPDAAEPIISPWLTTKQAAVYCNTALSTFRTWTVRRYKPKKGCLYNQADLDEYIKDHVRRSDEELTAAPVAKRQELLKGGGLCK